MVNAPKLVNVRDDISQLIVPKGCRASALLKRVVKDGVHHYSWVAIQYATGKTSVSVSCRDVSGGEFVRFDVAKGEPSRDALLTYLDSAGTSGGDPPIIEQM